MVILNRRFGKVGSLRPTRQADGTPYTHRPQKRYVRAGATPLHRYGDGEFCEFCLPDAPPEAGVYTLCVAKEIIYVGEARSLRKRLYDYGHISPRNCFQRGRQTNCRINKLVLEAVRNGHDVDVWFHACDDHKQFEPSLLAAIHPSWNRQGRT